MSKFNTCEKEHEDIEGFFAAVAEEGKALRIAEALGATSVIRLSRTPTIIDLVTGTIPVVCENGDAEQQIHERAAKCAAAIIDNSCTQFQFVPNESLATFEIIPKGGY